MAADRERDHGINHAGTVASGHSWFCGGGKASGSSMSDFQKSYRPRHPRLLGPSCCKLHVPHTSPHTSSPHISTRTSRSLSGHCTVLALIMLWQTSCCGWDMTRESSCDVLDNFMYRLVFTYESHICSASSTGVEMLRPSTF